MSGPFAGYRRRFFGGARYVGGNLSKRLPFSAHFTNRLFIFFGYDKFMSLSISVAYANPYSSILYLGMCMRVYSVCVLTFVCLEIKVDRLFFTFFFSRHTNLSLRDSSKYGRYRTHGQTSFVGWVLVKCFITRFLCVFTIFLRLSGLRAGTTFTI